jgi:GNAT superfamily N-acetyltransferase
MSIQISEWDTNHFGFKIAQLPYFNDQSYVKQGVQESKFHNVKLLINRCPTDDFKWIHELERRGFQLMDTIVYYILDLVDFYIPETKYQARTAVEGDIPAIRSIARDSFKEYHSHFSADRKLDKNKCDEVYELWAVNSFHDKNLADHIVVIEMEGKIAGFNTIKLQDKGKTGEGRLSAIHPFARKKGLYTDLIIHGLKWMCSQGCIKSERSTQITNISSQKTYTKIGYNIERSFYTFHLWI